MNIGIPNILPVAPLTDFQVSAALDAFVAGFPGVDEQTLADSLIAAGKRLAGCRVLVMRPLFPDAAVVRGLERLAGELGRRCDRGRLAGAVMRLAWSLDGVAPRAVAFA